MSRFLQRNDKFERRTHYSTHKRQYYQADLVDLSSKNAGYILNCIDVFSRYLMSVKLKDKSKNEIKRGFNEIFEKNGSPENLQTDLESGIYSNLMLQWLEMKKVNLFYISNSYNGKNSAAIVERVQRTQKYYYVDYKKQYNLNHATTAFQIVDEFQKNYNNTNHSFFKNKMTPLQAWNDNNNGKVLDFQNKNVSVIKKEPKEGFKVGDVVRLQKPEEAIEEKFEEQFYPWEYKIVEIKQTNPTTYKLEVKTSNKKNEIGLILDGSYYAQQLKYI